MHTQVVKPAGVGHESLWVVIMSAVVVLVAGIVISLRVAPDVITEIAAHQIDARHDLTIAEQGVFADLLVAVDEIVMPDLHASPSVEQLSEDGISPFARDMAATQRGAHQWTLERKETADLYVGVTSAIDTAGTFLLRVPNKKNDGHAHDAHAASDIWINRVAGAHMPTKIEDADLIRTGWRQVVTQFDAGVTRQQR